jgi:hypothetical protein
MGKISISQPVKIGKSSKQPFRVQLSNINILCEIIIGLWAIWPG